MKIMRAIDRLVLMTFFMGVLFNHASAQSSKDYYPLHIGDYWVQHSDSSFNEYNPRTFRIDIEGSDIIRGNTCLRMRQTLTPDNNPIDANDWYSWIQPSANEILIKAFSDTGIIVDMTIENRNITVDGNPADWTGVSPLVEDAQDDDSVRYTGDDIKALYVATNGANLFIRMDLWDDVNINFQNGMPPYEGKYSIEILSNGPYNSMQIGIVYDMNGNQWSLGFNNSSTGVPTGLQGAEFVGVNGSVIELRLPYSLIGNPTVYYQIRCEATNYYYTFGSVLDEAHVRPTTVYDPPISWLPPQLDQVGSTTSFNAPGMGGRYFLKVASLTKRIQVPAGTFDNCLQITQIIINADGDTTQKMQIYYAKGVGEVLKHGWQEQSGNVRYELMSYFIHSVQVKQDTVAVAGDSVKLAATLPAQSFNTPASRLYYRQAGQKNWRYTPIVVTGNNLKAAIPPDSVTYKGLEYYFHLTNGQEVITYPEFEPEKHPVVVQVAVKQIEAPVALPKTNFKMISIPILLNDPRIFEVIMDDYGEVDNKSWRLFRWQDGDYLEHPKIAANFSPGSAFWLITREGKPFDIENGLSMNSSQPVQITLDPGWNQMGNPFPFPIVADSVFLPIISLVQKPVFYDGTQYHYDATVLEPWEGYFVFNKSLRPLAITISPTAVAGHNLAKYAQRFQPDPEEYLIQLSAEIPGTRMVDSQNFIGLYKNATDGSDLLDFAEAPPIGDYLQVSIMEGMNRFAGNFKPLSNEGQCWPLELSTSTREKKDIQVSLIETGYRSEGFSIYILDQDYLCPIPVIGPRFTVDLSTEFPVRHLKILIGTEEFAINHSDAISLEPIEFRLRQNYPNPFNPSTNIQYQIGRRGPVRLVIYNYLGQKVRTLVNEIQNPGIHSIIWKGDNDLGQAVASGVYTYRIQARDFIDTRKLVLIH